jgi:hypothetical protein
MKATSKYFRVASSLFGPVAAVFLAQSMASAQSICTITNSQFICSAEQAKFSTLQITIDSASNSTSCSTPCSAGATIKAVANSSWTGTKSLIKSAGVYDANGDPPYPPPTGDKWKIRNPGDEAEPAAKDVKIACGTSYLLDLSYAAGDCPTSTPDGPGPCSIAAITFSCSACN